MELTRKEKYHRYLKSDWWKEIKKRKLGKICAVCSSKNYLLLHHFSYEKIYKPRITNASKDTITLCQQCHHIVHTVQKERKATYEETVKIIKELRNDFLVACKINRFYEEQLFNRTKYD